MASGGPDGGPLMGLDGKPKVDSGASGFAKIIEGFMMAYNGRLSAEKMTDKSLLQSSGIQAQPPMSDGMASEHELGDDYPFQYCTEAAIALKTPGSGKEVEAFFREYQEQGKCDSMAGVFTDTLFKLHVHTNTPAEVFALAAEKFSKDGALLAKEKVEVL